MAPLVVQHTDDISFSCTDENVVYDIQQGQGVAKGPLHESTLIGAAAATATTTTTSIISTIRRRRRRRRNGSVSFGAMVDVQEVLHRCDYTPEERSASWFDLDDMKRMKQTARVEGRWIDAGRLTTSETTSIRGLEHRTISGLKSMRRAVLGAYAAVSFEIDFQHHEHFFDDDAIADAYYMYSKPCAAIAAAIAKTDELEAMTIYGSNSNE